MSLKLHIADFDNAAFSEDWRDEVAGILRRAAEKIEGGEDYFVLKDVNGNTVGECGIDPPVILKNYVVCYFDANDPDLDNHLEFHCEAEDEGHADRLCEEAHPGCCTTHIEEKA